MVTAAELDNVCENNKVLVACVQAMSIAFLDETPFTHVSLPN
jgi:hypothetical protein